MGEACAACITPEVIRALNRPTGSARGLPRQIYTDPEFFALERDRMLAATWFCVGVTSDLPQRGYLLPRDLAGIPLLLVRDRENAVRAFHNVCSHRGVQLVDEPRAARGYHMPVPRVDLRIGRAVVATAALPGLRLGPR